MGAGPSKAPTDPPPVVEASGITRTEKDVPVPQVKSGEQLNKRLTKILALTGWFQDLKVTSQDGVVNLQGKVSEASQRDWAMKLAQDTEGVVAVIDNIQLKDMGWFDLGPTRKELKSLWKSILGSLPHLAIGIVILALTISLFRTLSVYSSKFWTGRMANPMISDLVGKIGALPILLIGLYLFLQVLGLTGLAFSILGGTGAVGLVAGFAFKNILENYFSGLMLSIRRPFIVGDVIEVAGQKGAVFSLSSRGTTLVDDDGNHILIPNSTIFTSIIKNQSVATLTRVRLTFDVKPGDSPENARAKVLRFLAERPEIASDPQAEAHSVAHGERTRIEVSFWIQSRETDAQKLKALILTKMTGDASEVSVKGESATPSVKSSTEKILERAAKDSQDSGRNVLLEPNAPAREF